MESWGRGVVALGVMLAAMLVCVQSVSVHPVDTEGRTPFKRLCGPVCKIYCRYGNVLDSQGCPTCKCRPRPICPRGLCLKVLRCPTGYVKVNGCPVCRCRPSKCKALVTCRMFCPFGYVRDENGCSLCKCQRGLPFQFSPKLS